MSERREGVSFQNNETALLSTSGFRFKELMAGTSVFGHAKLGQDAVGAFRM